MSRTAIVSSCLLGNLVICTTEFSRDTHDRDTQRFDVERIFQSAQCRSHIERSATEYERAISLPNCCLNYERIQSLWRVPVRLVASWAHVPPRTVPARCSPHVPGTLGSVHRAPHGLLPGNFPIATSFKRAAREALSRGSHTLCQPFFSHTHDHTWPWGHTRAACSV
jgi:hypothetical protein